ncbi:MAG: hypothetical protein WD960_08490 [Gemmatimonadota bacterium]
MASVIKEVDVKKDGRNRVTLPDAAFEHYHVRAFDDGHYELYPRVLADPLISARTLEMMDASMASLKEGQVGEPLDPDAMLSALDDA